MIKKLKAALSDTDILIHLASGDRLDILDMLFEEVVIPSFVYNQELTKKAGCHLSGIQAYIASASSVCRVVDREKDTALNIAALTVINEKKIFCGRGESECAGYATAMDIAIIVSDNKRDFRHFPEYIMLTYTDLLALCIHRGLMSFNDAKNTFVTINSQLQFPTGMTFERILTDSNKQIKINGWSKELGVIERDESEAAMGSSASFKS